MQECRWKKLKKKNQVRYQKLLVWLKIYNYFRNMSHEFRLKNINETRKYFLKGTE